MFDLLNKLKPVDLAGMASTREAVREWITRDDGAGYYVGSKMFRKITVPVNKCAAVKRKM